MKKLMHSRKLRSSIFAALTIIGFFLFQSFSLNVLNENSEKYNSRQFEKRWKEVDELIKNDLPRSVVEATDGIFRDALATRNLPQMMKAFLVRAEYKNLISPDSAKAQIELLEKWASDENDIQAKALLNCIMGQVTVNKSPVDVVSALGYFRKSLQSRDSLAVISAGDFYPVVLSKDDSKEFFDDNMYDFLARQAIQSLLMCRHYEFQDSVHSEVMKIYDSLQELYSGNVTGIKRNLRAEALTREARVIYLSDYSISGKYRLSNDEAIGQLLTLADEYAGSDVYCDISLKLAGKYMSASRFTDAMNVIEGALSLYPKSEWKKDLLAMADYIKSPSLSVSVPFVYPGLLSDLNINYKNLTHICIETYRVDVSPESELLKGNIDFKNLIKKYGERVKVDNYTLPATKDYKLKETSLKYGLPEAGIYVLKLSSRVGNTIADTKPVYEMMFVSPYQCVMLTLPGCKKELIAVDRMTGMPVPGAEIVSENVYITDLNGSVVVDVTKDKLEHLRVRTKGNDFMPVSYNPSYTSTVSYYNNAFPVKMEEEKVVRNTLFTDRAIYRPGQKVFVSGIMYTQKGDSAVVVSGDEVVVSFTDSKGKLVSEIKCSTDEFGVYTAEFDVPKNVQPGYWGVRCNNAYVSVRVEEYKRPTFDIVFDKQERSFAFGDSLKATALVETFAGAPVRMSKVKYRITRAEAWWGRMPSFEVELVSGDTITDNDGRFAVDFLLTEPEESDDNRPVYPQRFYRYKVTAVVTSQSGETQEGVYVVSVGNNSLGFQIKGLGSLVAKEKQEEIQLVALNMDNIPVDTEIDYVIYKVQGNTTEEVVKDRCLSQDSFYPDWVDSLSSGKYRIEVSAKDDKGRNCSYSQDFVLFSLDDSRPPIDEVLWFYQDGDFSTSKADIYIGSCENDVYLMVDVFTSDSRIDSKRMVLSDSIEKFSFTYKEEYGDGITIVFTFMRNGELYTRTVNLYRPFPEKKLTLSWSSFRDNLVPGVSEEWILSVKDKDGNPVKDANLLASAYDVSLDRLYSGIYGGSYSHGFGVSTIFGRRFMAFPSVGRLSVSHSVGLYGVYPGINYRDGLNLLFGEGFTYLMPYSLLSYNDRIFVKSNSMMAGARNDKLAQDKIQEEVFEEETAVAAPSEALSSVEEVPSVRENFNETAFYYPSLRTDSLGNVRLSFVMPDALTEWRFNALAHTKDMFTGNMSDVFTTSKPFMVQPNIPRFVRVGDYSSVSASVINMSMKDIAGNVTMTLTNPDDGNVVFKETRRFSVKEGETEAVTFSYHMDVETETLVCSIVGVDDLQEFSDGECHYLPVLSHKQWVTENMSLQLRGDTVVDVLIDKKPGMKLTVEMVPNPESLVVKALPVLGIPQNEDSFSWATALYVNSVSKLIDDKEVDYNLDMSVSKLAAMQLADGSWPWFSGMKGNRYITTQIVQLIARMKYLGVASRSDVDAVYLKALNYLKKEVAQEYSRMKSDEDKYAPSDLTVDYLYICSIDKMAGSYNDKTINDFMVDYFIGKSAQLDISGKSYMSLIMRSHGNNAEADLLVKSVMEYLVSSDEMGAYFDSSKAGYTYHSYRIPTHVSAMEAIRMVGGTDNILDEMKLWLLKQKQVQVWDNPISTVNAIYAFSSDSSLVFNKKEGTMKMEIDDRTDSHKVSVVREGAGIGWASVLTQYKEDIDKIVAYTGDGLNIERRYLFNGKEIDDNSKLSVGDKITVQLIVRSDRDMDFVCVKDSRPACVEPATPLSRFNWMYYMVNRDTATEFYIDKLVKGEHTYEYDVYINRSGEYSSGVASVESVYAPEFGSHTSGGKLSVVQ